MNIRDHTVVGYLDDDKVLAIPYGTRQNMLVLGEIGSGKTSIIRLKILQDIRAKRGFLLIENHSELSNEVLSMIPPEEYDRIVYVNLTSIRKFEKTLRFNPLENQDPYDAGMVALNFTECLAKAFADSWGARVETCARNGSLGVIGTDSDTIGAMLSLLTNEEFRNTFIPNIKNKISKDFFTNVYDKQYPKEAGGVIFNKLNKMLTIPELDAMFNVKRSSVDFKDILDDQRYVIIDLGGGLPNDMVKFLGNVFMHLFYVRYKKRERGPDGTFAPFNLYLDEVQMLSSQMVRELLNTVRKYGIKATIATQSLSALDNDLADEIMTLCRSIACFRCDAKTAQGLKSVLPISPEKQQQLSFHYFSFYSAGDKPIHAIAKTRHLNIPPRSDEAMRYSLNNVGENVSLEKYYSQMGGSAEVLLTPLEFGILNLLRTENRDMTKDEIILMMKRRYTATSRQIATALLDTLMATNNFVSKKDVSSDDGDDRFESRYVITNAAMQRIFSQAAVGRRSGGDLHLSAIFFIMNIQTNLGKYCIPDLGRNSDSKADLTIWSPKIVKGNDGGKEQTYNPFEWEDDATAVEVEATPGKHASQIPINWEKNNKMGNFVHFVVFNQKDHDIVLDATRNAGIDRKNFALQILDVKALSDDNLNNSLRTLTEIQSAIYEVIINAGGNAVQDAIVERLYRYEQADVLASLADLHSKKRLAMTGNRNSDIRNQGAKITWSLCMASSPSSPSPPSEDHSRNDAEPRDDIQNESDSHNADDVNIGDADMGDMTPQETLQQTIPQKEEKAEEEEEEESDAPNDDDDVACETPPQKYPQPDLSENDGFRLEKNCLDDMTEQMLLAIWEGHTNQDDMESARRISDELEARGFAIRHRNGSHHLYRKPKAINAD